MINFIDRLIEKSLGTIWEWFWVYLFGILCAAVLIGTVYGAAYIFDLISFSCGAAK